MARVFHFHRPIPISRRLSLRVCALSDAKHSLVDHEMRSIRDTGEVNCVVPQKDTYMNIHLCKKQDLTLSAPVDFPNGRTMGERCFANNVWLEWSVEFFYDLSGKIQCRTICW